MSTPAAILTRLESATSELHAAALAALKLSRALLGESAARAADDDDWRRLPRPQDRCPISGWSRSAINRRIAAGSVRKKQVDGSTYYAAADVRALLQKA